MSEPDQPEIENPESLPMSLMHSVVNEYSTETLMDLGETVVDDIASSVFNSDVLTKLPVVGGLVALGKGVSSYRDRRYVSKILSFLSETSKASDDDKKKYRQKLDADAEECSKAGEVILDLIDKITSTEKAVMIGKVFRAFMHETDLTTNQLVYMCEIIERTYLQDLISLQKSEVHNETNLESVGIRKPMRVEDVNKAIDAAISRMLAQMPVVREGPINTDEEPKVVQSGLTDAGYNLQRILRSY